MRDPLFSTPAAGPDAASWLTAGLRALHPARWVLALAGLAATAVAAALFQALFAWHAPRLADWFAEPAAQVQALGTHLAGRSTLGIAIRLGTLLSVVAGIWGVIGGWIARHELLARHRGQPYATAERIEPGPTGLVTRQLKNLVVGFPAILLMCALLSLPLVLAGGVNHLGGMGAVIVAVLLPVVLVADLILLLIALGLTAWPLMPVTIAAENSDTFDALSRSYNYAYQRPLRFVLLTAVATAAAAAPTAAVLYVLAGPIENWVAASGHPAVWAAAGLSLSIFWSLQTLVYLRLRTAVDETDAGEIAHDGQPKPEPAPAVAEGGETKPPAPKPSLRLDLLNQLLILGFMAATWIVTAWLFGRLGGETAGWLGWGIGDGFRPPAEGLYEVASVIAGVWGAIWIAAPVVVALRRALRSEPTPEKPLPAT
jgi:hypothetical protein